MDFSIDSSTLISIGIVVGGVVVALAPTISDWWKNKSRDIFNRFDKNVKIRLKIKETTKEILNRFQAQRVVIFNYHNGDYSKSGIPFDYVSIIYETTDSNTTPIMQNFQKLPISLFTTMLNDIVDNQSVGYLKHCIDEENIDEETKQQMIAYGTHTVYHFIFSNQAKDGVISVNFVRNHKLDEEEINWMRYKTKELYRLQMSIK
jgi:hypothetical protein